MKIFTEILRWIALPIAFFAVPAILFLLAHLIGYLTQYHDMAVFDKDGSYVWGIGEAILCFMLYWSSVHIITYIAPRFKKTIAVIVCLIYIISLIFGIIEVGLSYRMINYACGIIGVVNSTMNVLRGEIEIGF